MTYSNLELQNLAYRMVDCGILEENDVDPLYRKYNSLNNYLNSGLIALILSSDNPIFFLLVDKLSKSCKAIIIHHPLIF